MQDILRAQGVHWPDRHADRSANDLPASAWAVIAFLLLLVSLSNDSIDMMESQTWDYARHDTFAGFYRELHTDSAPEAQMPLGMFSFWAWSRAFGTGELAMRSLNLVWAAIFAAFPLLKRSPEPRAKFNFR